MGLTMAEMVKELVEIVYSERKSFRFVLGHANQVLQ